VVDTSGAGDAFNGALAIALASGHSIVDATRFACAAAAIITQGPGLEDALPLWDGLSVPPVGAPS
jgi:sugar/nucleoside kinase (ribokinase family)